MSTVTREDIKANWITGYGITQLDYANLVDSIHFKTSPDDVAELAGNVSPLITPESIGAATNTHEHPFIVSTGIVSPTISGSHFTIDGLVITCPTVTAALYNNNIFNGKPSLYTVNSASLTGTDNQVNYVYIDYNNGTPVYKITTDVSLINESSTIPVNTTLATYGYLHPSHWDDMGNGLLNKLHRRLIKTQRYARESGLTMASSGSKVWINEGVVWRGGRAFDLTTITSEDSYPALWFFIYPVNGVWHTSTTSGAFDYKHYSNGSNLVTLYGTNPNNYKYNINWVYRGVEDANHAYFILGEKEYDTWPNAVAETKLPTIPEQLSSHALLVGRIICQKNNPVPIFVESSYDLAFIGTPINNHNELSNIQGGTTSEYYHLTATEYTGTGTGAFVRDTNPTINFVTTAPSAANAPGTTGQIIIATPNSGTNWYLYTCVNTNTWKRVELTSW